MKKILSVLAIIAVSVSLFAFDLNLGVDPVQGFETTASVSAHIGSLEVGGGVYTSAFADVIASVLEGDFKGIGDKIVQDFQNATYGFLGHVYFDILDSRFKFAAGAIADLGVGKIESIQEIKDRNITLDASIKGAVVLDNTFGAFVQVGLPVARLKLNPSAGENIFSSLIENEFIDYLKANVRFNAGLVFSI